MFNSKTKKNKINDDDLMFPSNAKSNLRNNTQNNFDESMYKFSSKELQKQKNNSSVFASKEKKNYQNLRR